MIEADGNDQHGGIFSIPNDFSLLSCPTTGNKPTVLKRFGTWNEATENIAANPIYLTQQNGIFLTANTDSCLGEQVTCIITILLQTFTIYIYLINRYNIFIFASILNNYT